MKCGYNKCKNGGQVEKEVAIKIGNRYYCKECFSERDNKQKIEEYWNDNMPSCTLVMLRKAVNTLIDKNEYDAEYILYALKWIKSNKKPLNYPMGLVNYCNNVELKNKYNKEKVRVQYQQIKHDIVINGSEDKVKFKYIPNNKKFTDLL